MAQEAQALRYSANFFETLDGGNVDFLCGAPVNPNIPYMKKMLIIFMRAVIVKQYTLLQPKEDFRSWIKQRTKTLSLVKSVCDPEHPSGFDRAKKMRAAADVLEAKQKETVELPAAAQAA